MLPVPKICCSPLRQDTVQATVRDAELVEAVLPWPAKGCFVVLCGTKWIEQRGGITDLMSQYQPEAAL